MITEEQSCRGSDTKSIRNLISACNDNRKNMKALKPGGGFDERQHERNVMSTGVTASWCEKYLGAGDGNAMLYCIRIVAQINEFAHHRANVLMFFILRKDESDSDEWPRERPASGRRAHKHFRPKAEICLWEAKTRTYHHLQAGRWWRNQSPRALSIMNIHTQSACCSRSSGMQHWWVDSFFSNIHIDRMF